MLEWNRERGFFGQQVELAMGRLAASNTIRLDQRGLLDAALSGRTTGK